jgi:PiT family inorganic phosphate transporter
MASSWWLLGAIVLTALLFDYVNGFHDTANSIATTVLTGALSVPMAIFMAASLNFLGAFMNSAVATTIGKGIVDPSAISLKVIWAALLGAIVWDIITWWQGLPCSSSHALIGGIVGAVIAENGTRVFEIRGLEKIGLALLISPFLGLVVGHMFMVSLMWLFRHTAPGKLTRSFKVIQIFSAASMALSHGGNDTQKTMGVITMALASAGFLPSFDVPFWVILICATAMALGTAAGGWRIIKTVGRNLLVMQPVHGFAAETSGAAVIFAATAFGAPVSTTHVISSAIMGVGSAKSLNGVRWNIVRQIVQAWVLTLPVSALLGACFALLFRAILP